jgi:hypothetical protein
MSDPFEQNPKRPTKPASRPSAGYAASGVDRSLIRWMLSLTPTERLMAIQQQVNAVQEMKEQIDSD